MKLAIIVPRFNPLSYVRPQQNFDRFIESLRQQVDTDDMFMCLALYPKQSRDADWSIPADERHCCWQKEAIISRAIQELPAAYDSACWLDADLIFQNPDWYAQTCQMLSDFPVVQMFEKIVYLGPDDAPLHYNHGTASSPDRLSFNAPGGAIACRRELLTNGIYDRHPLGGNDEIFMDACLGRGLQFYQPLNPPFREHVRNWCESFGQHDVGFVPGMVKHLWHGDRQYRQYRTRDQLLVSHDFNPATDVRIGDNGLLEWASDKPALHAAVRDFFAARKEDG